MAQETVFADGMKIEWLGKNHPDRPSGAPDFALGKLSFSQKFIETLTSKSNDAGYVNIDIKKSKAGNIYAAVNMYGVKAKGSDTPPAVTGDVDMSHDDDIPF